MVVARTRTVRTFAALGVALMLAASLGGCGRRGRLVAAARSQRSTRGEIGSWQRGRPQAAPQPADPRAEDAVHSRPASLNCPLSSFTYRNGVLHAEALDLREIADAVGTPFYCYSRAAMEAQYRAFDVELRHSAQARLLRHEGELEPGRAAGLRQARGRDGRRFGRRTPARPGGRRTGPAHHLLGRRQDAGASWRLASTKTSCASTSSRRQSSNRFPRSRPARA